MNRLSFASQHFICAAHIVPAMVNPFLTGMSMRPKTNSPGSIGNYTASFCVFLQRSGRKKMFHCCACVSGVWNLLSTVPTKLHVIDYQLNIHIYLIVWLSLLVPGVHRKIIVPNPIFIRSKCKQETVWWIPGSDI